MTVARSRLGGTPNNDPVEGFYQVRRVVGVDLSLAKTGIGIVVLNRQGTHIASSSISSVPTPTGPMLPPKGKRTKPYAKETLDDRLARQRTLAAEIDHYTRVADLVVIEGLFTGPTAGSIIDRSALWFRVVDRCRKRGTPVAVLAPMALKKVITGNGKGDKAAVAGAMVNMYPGLEIRNADEADAMALAHLGAVLLGWPVTTLERHRSAVWTDHPSDCVGADLDESAI